MRAGQAFALLALFVLASLPEAQAEPRRFESHVVEAKILVDAAGGGPGEARVSTRLPEGTTWILLEVDWPQGGPASADTLILRFDRPLSADGLGAWEADGPARLGFATTPDVQRRSIEWVVLVGVGDQAAKAVAVDQHVRLALSSFMGDARPGSTFSALEGRFDLASPDAGSQAHASAAPTWAPSPVDEDWHAGLALVGLGLPLLAWRRGLALLVALFTRLDRHRLLAHPRRAALYEAVLGRGPVRTEEVRRLLGLSNGAFRHHLALMVSAGLLRTCRRGHESWLTLPASPPVRSFLETLRDLIVGRGGADVDDLAHATGRTPANVRHHLRILVRGHHVVAVRQGRRLRFFPRPGPGEAP